MQTFWEDDLKVRAYDIDFKNKLKVSSIFNYMQDIASTHADNLNVGYRQLLEKELFWVLSWVKLEFNNLPQFEDKFKIKTWPKGRYKLYALRDFLLFDNSGGVFCRIASAWLLINAKSKRITDLKNLSIEFPYQPDEHALTDLPAKIPVVKTGGIAFSKKINYSDIDINRHVNNEKYIEYILDCYPNEFHERNRMKSMTVSFISETKFNDEIQIGLNTSLSANGLHYLEGINKGAERLAFQSLIEWDTEKL